MKSCFVAGDSWGVATAVHVADAWSGEVNGLALGHARLSNRLEGERAPVNKAVRRLDLPLLFARHEGCLGSTEEGFEDAVAAFPQARVVSMSEAPAVSPAFAQAIRSFCLELA